jgi:myo-inositol 2-dehydrogenase / D-chiro-inositol 1-dehydrogenase
MASTSVTRRTFIGQAATAGAALSLAQARPAHAGANNTINVGVIGAGGRNSYLLDRILQHVKDARIVAICDLEEKKVSDMSEKVVKKGQPKPKPYVGGPKEYLKLMEDKDVDALFIATPCDLHAPMYLDALERNKDTYGEKPMCIQVADCNKLVAAQEKSKAKLQIGFQRRCNPRYIEGVKMLREGKELGTILEARGAWLNVWGPLRGWFSKRERSGDWMLEQACHTWDVFNWVFGGPPVKAYGQGRRDIFTEGEADRDVTDYFTADIEWPGGVVVDYIHSWFCPPDNGFDGVYERLASLKGGIDLSVGKVTYREKGKEAKKIDGPGCHEAEDSINSFFDCVRNNKKPQSTVTTAREATLAGLLIRMAVDERRTVTMEEMLKKTA